MNNLIITVDGPAASGKEKISKYISKNFKLKHLDSGLLYRRLAYIFLNKRIDIDNVKQINKILKQINKISYRNTKKIRTQQISIVSSKIAIYGIVRKFVNNLQYEFVRKNKNYRGFVIDGRDIGSVVFKKAKLKLYIEVNPEIRAKRRYKQLIDSGEKSIYRTLLKEIKLRDIKDKKRKNSPLIIPKDAYIVNNDGSFRKTVKQINNILKTYI
ncbi:(d)CMP kinase [Pelagibacteraceae bacterium]|nr:(d)CMP kinase [Pelagibacteraceae bacterium]